MSIVVLSKDDPSIENTLDALVLHRATVEPPADIVVVDSSSDQSISEMARIYTDSVSWLRYPAEKRRESKTCTIPEQRNLGVRNASGDIVVFIDASCVPSPNWLPSLIAPILTEGESLVVGPAVASSSSSNMWTKHTRLISDKGRLYVREAPTINIAIAKRVFSRVGLFDEAFSYGSDVDFTMRAVSCGFRIRFIEQAYVTHDWGNYRQQMKRAWNYAEARVRIYRKHPRALKDLLGRDFVTLSYATFVAMLPLTLVAPWFPLLLVVPIIKNRGNLPVRTVAMNLWWGACVLANCARFASGRHK